jgi:cytochrome c-type protein NapB
VTAVTISNRNPSDACRECHDPARVGAVKIASNWPAAAWPQIHGASDAPPPIPHDLHLRGNCLACHAGPGAVIELRTDHPERANCRQCHLVEETNTQTFVQPGVTDFNRGSPIREE